MVNPLIPPLRILLDSNVLFSAIGWQGTPHIIYTHTQQGNLSLVTTEYILGEVASKLAIKNPVSLPRFEEFVSDGDFELVASPSLEEVEANMDLVARDPNDVPIALIAIQARVDYLISGDQDFFDSVNTRLHKAIMILTPKQFFDQIIEGKDQ